MSDNVTTGGGTPKLPRSVKLRIALGMLPEPSGRPPYIWLERWDAFIVGVCLAVGTPLLGLSGFAPLTKWIIAAIWFAVYAPFFSYFEGRELIGQMHGRGSIRAEQAAEQENTAQDPFYGIATAVGIWVVVWAVHVALQKLPDDTTWHFVDRKSVV